MDPSTDLQDIAFLLAISLASACFAEPAPIVDDDDFGPAPAASTTVETAGSLSHGTSASDSTTDATDGSASTTSDDSADTSTSASADASSGTPANEESTTTGGITATTTAAEPDLCTALANKEVECWQDENAFESAYVYCSTYIAYYFDHPECQMAWEDRFACLVELGCADYLADKGCDGYWETIENDEICPFWPPDK
jgi:hypothetical protein